MAHSPLRNQISRTSPDNLRSQVGTPVVHVHRRRDALALQIRGDALHTLHDAQQVAAREPREIVLRPAAAVEERDLKKDGNQSGSAGSLVRPLTKAGYLDTSSKPLGVTAMPSKSLPRPTLGVGGLV